MNDISISVTTSLTDQPSPEGGPAIPAPPECDIWVPINGWNGIYEINNKGHVRRLKGRFCPDAPRLLNPKKNTSGYFQVRLSNNGYFKAFTLHRLLCLTFKPNPLLLPVVNHIDGNKLNNDLDNLEWTTYKQNNDHAMYVLGKNRGSARAFAKLNESDIPIIRTLTSRGFSTRQIGRLFATSGAAISHISTKRSWTHVD